MASQRRGSMGKAGLQARRGQNLANPQILLREGQPIDKEGMTCEKAVEWGPFTDWTPDEANMWMTAGFHPKKTNYWLSQSILIPEMRDWTAAGVTMRYHRLIKDYKMSLVKCMTCRETGIPIADVAD